MPGTPNHSPVYGYPVVVVLPELRRILWWGEDADGVDVVATVEGRVASWSLLGECRAEAGSRGWMEATPDDPPTLMDLRPAAAWSTGHSRAMSHAALLNTWNLAADIARCGGSSWHDRGVLADACHAKLSYASVPWLVGSTTYAPRWSGPELRHLHRRIGTALTVLRRGLTSPRHHHDAAQGPRAGS